MIRWTSINIISAETLEMSFEFEKQKNIFLQMLSNVTKLLLMQNELERSLKRFIKNENKFVDSCKKLFHDHSFYEK